MCFLPSVAKINDFRACRGDYEADPSLLPPPSFFAPCLTSRGAAHADRWGLKLRYQENVVTTAKARSKNRLERDS